MINRLTIITFTLLQGGIQTNCSGGRYGTVQVALKPKHQKEGVSLCWIAFRETVISDCGTLKY